MLLLRKKQQKSISFSLLFSPESTTLISMLTKSYHHLLLTNVLCYSTSTKTTPTTPQPAPNPSFILHYLINTRGISPDKALRASKYLTHVTSSAKPDSVIHFLKHHGFNDSQINDVICKRPTALCSDVNKTLLPKLNGIKDLGFSVTELLQLVSEDPRALYSRNFLSNIRFWQTKLGSNSKVLKAFKKDHDLASCSVDRIVPNIAFLRRCGLLERHITSVVMTTPKIVSRDLDSLKELVERADEFGVPRDAGMYWCVLRTLCCVSRSKVEEKSEILRSLGWPEDEIMATFRRSPAVLFLSKRNICDTVGFLVKEAGCELSYLIRVPAVMTYSLKKRLIPRICVLKALKAKLLPLGEADLFNAVMMSDEMFLNKFVLPHEASVPGIREAYKAACEGNLFRP